MLYQPEKQIWISSLCSIIIRQCQQCVLIPQNADQQLSKTLMQALKEVKTEELKARLAIS